MSRVWLIASCLALAGCSAASQPSGAAKDMGQNKSPVVIELFQSQGCSSCPPALAVLAAEADQPGVLALNYAVTYWDYLGWKDDFARPEFTARQWSYARAGGRGNVQTPQLIVNGTTAVLGSRKAEVDATIRAAQPNAGTTINIGGSRIQLAGAKLVKSHAVIMVSYDPRAYAVPIRAGENDGRTLVHRNIVKKLTVLGRYAGGTASYALPHAEPGLARAILVQQDDTGPIRAARKI
jgi:hypothetical protein